MPNAPSNPDQGKRLRVGPAIAIIAAMVLTPVVWLDQIRRPYTLVIQRYLAKIVQPEFVFVGDSLAVGWNQNLPATRLKIVNFAQGGTTVAQVSRQVSSAAGYHAATMVITAGINDILLQGRTAQQIGSDYDVVLRQNSGTAAVVVTLIPYTSDTGQSRPIAQANAAIARIAAAHGAIVIDLNPSISRGQRRLPQFTDDGIHFTPAAYAVWRDKLLASLSMPPCARTGTRPCGPAP
jgi:lysophospholipase L1-like esterase